MSAGQNSYSNKPFRWIAETRVYCTATDRVMFEVFDILLKHISFYNPENRDEELNG